MKVNKKATSEHVTNNLYNVYYSDGAMDNEVSWDYIENLQAEGYVITETHRPTCGC